MFSNQSEQATLGGGCFWCLEAVFLDVKGVKSVVSGYAGGHLNQPTYAQICTGTTGHAEVVQVTYDPQTISYQEILDIFFAVHDPTTINRQGADIGPQYRSIILYHSDQQRQIAEAFIAQQDQAQIWATPVVTEVQALEEFFRAEEYHQEYYRRNAYQPYCRVVVAPKVNKFRTRFPDRLKID